MNPSPQLPDWCVDGSLVTYGRAVKRLVTRVSKINLVRKAAGWVPNSNIIIFNSNTRSGASANGDVVAARSVAKKRRRAYSRIAAPGVRKQQCRGADGRVERAEWCRS